MKIKLLFILLVIGFGITMAQSQYPLVSIHDIQYIDGVDTVGWVESQYRYDTVRVVGVIMISPLVDAESNRQPIMYYGNRWGTYIQDTSATATANGWSGLNVLLNDTTTAGAQNTFFDLTDTADVVELTGYLDTYGQTNEMWLITDPAIPVNILGKLPRRPAPLQMSLTDFMDNGVVNKGAMKYSGTYVEFHNVKSSDRNTSSGGFNINDENGNSMAVYSQSRYYRQDQYKMPGSTYEPPQDGTPINSIRGIITVYNNGFELLPIYPNDLTITATPPSITNILRDKIQVNTNQSVTISANISDDDGYVEGVTLHYRIGDGSRVVLTMDKSSTDTTLYTATIPGVIEDSTLVDYYISSNDNDGLIGYSPSDTLKGNYFYQVLDEPLTIRDVQYSPFGSGYSSYNGYYVTLTGIVTADTSDIPGFGSTSLRVYMQDGSGPWTGIMVGPHGNMGADILNFKRGDSVTLNGKIMESYSVTVIDSLKQITVNSNNNTLPAPVDLKTGDIDETTGADTSAEKWESVLVDYKNVTITDENADGDPGPNSYNFGESLLSDGSGDTRIEFQDGNHNYNNDWDSTLADNPSNMYVKLNSTFTQITGILFYSYSNYKLVPRKNDDFEGYVEPVGVTERNSEIPVSYKLEQNYPNPFNPSTTINFSIPKESKVDLKIFNILGQEVITLVNENKMPGSYSVIFDANKLSSGVYFYTIKAGSYYQVKKMLLLK